jgi:hypothetical protein
VLNDAAGVLPAAWNPQTLQESAGGDRVFARTLIDSFLEASARNHAAIVAACAAADRVGLRNAMHALKGISGYVGAAPLIDALTAATRALDRGESVTAQIGTVGSEIGRVEAGLRAYLHGPSADRPAGMDS